MRSTDLLLWIGLGVVILIGVLYRFVAIENIPGVNGDEAWYGVQMSELASGRHFSLLTPPGNVLNPFHSGVILLLQLVFPPSIWILRAPSLLTGVLLIPLTFFLMRRVTDATTGLIMTIFLSVLPISIAYSRFGWDTSQTTLATLLVIYFALRRHWIGLILASLSAVIIHPTNLFLGPVIAGILLPKVWGRDSRLRYLRSRTSLLLPASLILIVLVRLGIKSMWLWLPPWDVVRARLLSPTGWLHFMAFFGRLFTGKTSYAYIPGPPDFPGVGVDDLPFFIAVLPIMIFGGLRLWRRRDRVFFGLGVGMMISLIAFYVLVGLGGIAPHFERYSFWMIVPSLLAFALSSRALIRTPTQLRVSLASLSVVSFLFLLSFGRHYFGMFVRTGGLSHPAFQTAPVEPKKQALDLILGEASRASMVTILTESWWLYWPIRYLSSENPSVRVVSLDTRGDWPTAIRDGLLDGYYVVGFAGGMIETFMAGENLPPGLVTSWITDYADQPLVGVWRMSRIAGS